MFFKAELLEKSSNRSIVVATHFFFTKKLFSEQKMIFIEFWNFYVNINP